MEYCHTCHNYWDEGVSSCPICGDDMDDNRDVKWILLGMIEDKLSADFARETLITYNIPAVVISKSGFFGNIGLPLNPFYNANAGSTFEVSVPAEFAEDAAHILDMVVGEKWQRKER